MPPSPRVVRLAPALASTLFMAPPAQMRRLFTPGAYCRVAEAARFAQVQSRSRYTGVWSLTCLVQPEAAPAKKSAYEKADSGRTSGPERHHGP